MISRRETSATTGQKMKKFINLTADLISEATLQQKRFADFMDYSNQALESSQRLILESRQLVSDTRNIIARLQEFS